MTRLPTPIKTESGRPDYLISPEADKVLGKIIIWHFVAFFALLMLMTFFMAYLNIPSSRYYNDRHFLDMVSILIVMIPFFLGTNKFFRTRLQFGRDFVDKKQWKEAVASLEAFNHLGQRFFDPTGEAHYLLSFALAKEGRLQESEKVRDYVLKSHPSSPWAERIRKSEQIKPRAVRAPAKADSVSPAEQKLRPAPKGRKRRF